MHVTQKSHDWLNRCIRVCLCLLILLPVPALAQTYEQRFSKLQHQIERAPQRPQAVLELDQLVDLANNVENPERIYQLARKILANKRSSLQLRLDARWQLWEEAWRSGDTETIERALAQLGQITRWKVIGPFDNEGGNGFDTEYPPEKEYDPEALYPGKVRDVGWRNFPAISQLEGYQNFRVIFTPESNSTAYAMARVYAAKTQKALLVLAAGGSLKLWHNGEQVAAWSEERPARRIQTVVPITLKRGINTLLVKVNGREGDWGFRVGLLNAKGQALPKLPGLTPGETSDRRAPFPADKQTLRLRNTRPNKELPLAVQRLKRAFKKHPDVKGALSISQLHERRRAFEPEKKLHEEWAEKALELDGSNAEALLWCANVFGNHNRRYACLSQGRSLYPKDGRFSLALASFLQKEGQDLQAGNLLTTISDDPWVDIEAVEKRIEMYNEHSQPALALQLARELRKRYPQVRQSAIILAKQLERMNLDDESLPIRMSLANSNKGALATLHWIYSYHYRRRDLDTAQQWLQKMIELDPAQIMNRVRLSRLYQAQEKFDEARNCLQQALDISPEDTTLIDRLAELEHRMGRSDLAMELWRRSLEIMPQNPTLKEYLRLLEPQTASFENAYRRELEALVQAYPADVDSEEMAEELLELKVFKVFANGLSSHFHQQVVRVYTQGGIDRYRRFYVRYSPDRQEVRILKARVLRPDGEIVERYDEDDRSVNRSYKLYHDYRVHVVDFPDLQPGDVVELQYRLDDIAADNLFSDYFGNLSMMQGAVPIRDMQLVYLIPKEKPLYYNHPALKPEPQIQQLDGLIEYNWHVTDIPKIRYEAASPPQVEIADYLHVSTFKDIDALGNWYWGLIKEQFVPKEALKKKAREITADLSDPLEKIKAIYAWVVQNTRYVGLEFGIHSFKPYQVNQIYERKFGDCKDKATLMITLLREAGIRAWMTIIRTSNLGQIATYPPSLAMFNHAIVYLPDYDLYLDGTAEFSGPFELPYQDRGGQVMLLGEEKTLFTQVPAEDPAANLFRQYMTITLGDDNSATLTNRVKVSGSRASLFRSHFQDVKRRKEFLEKLINQDIPGAKLQNFQFDSIGDLMQPVSFNYEALLPDYLRKEGDGYAIAAHLDRVDLVKQFASLSKREQPVMIDRLQTLETTNEWQLGSRFIVTELPEAVNIENELGAFSMTFEQQGDMLRAQVKLVFKKNRIPQQRYEEFRAFCQEVTQAYRQEIKLRDAND